jgi:protein tyrosine phosphatase
VGRTGTYIVIDAMMKQIKQKYTINIHTFLKHIRHQRNYLVQTEEQFIFIYDVLVESLKSGETELNETSYKSYINSLNKAITVDGLKLIERQYQLIVEYKPKEYCVSYALSACNSGKNRTQQILPVNDSRVVLAKKPGVEGSDYINASYLHGCTRQNEFIVTQYPLEETKCCFWQMVWDNNSNQIVVLNASDTEKCDNYWPSVGDTMKCDSFTVMLREENFDMDFVIRDFLLQSIDEDYEFNCRMISACYWPDSCTPLESAFDLINKVRFYRMQCIASNTISSSPMASTVALMNAPPIIVHDLYGGARAATFCALYTFQDLIQLEGCVSVYELAKMYHLKRPGLWSGGIENIMLLYKAVECLYNDLTSNHQYQLKAATPSTAAGQLHLDPSSSYFLNAVQNNPAAMSLLLAHSQVSGSNLPLTLMQQHQQPLTAMKTHSLKTLAVTPASGGAHSQTLTFPPPLSSSNEHRHNSVLFQLQHHQQLLKEPQDNDASSTIPLATNMISTSMQAATMPENPHSPTSIKTSLMDIPARILPAFLNGYSSGGGSGVVQLQQQPHHEVVSNSESNNENALNIGRSFIKSFEKQQQRRSAESKLQSRDSSHQQPYRSSRAMKFMNTMMMKSASFKRALFSQSSSFHTNFADKNDELMQQLQMQSQSEQQKQQYALTSASAPAHTHKSSMASLKMETSQQSAQQQQISSAVEIEKEQEQKPPLIIAISSTPSSTTASSSSTVTGGVCTEMAGSSSTSSSSSSTSSSTSKSAFLATSANLLAQSQSTQQNANANASNINAQQTQANSITNLSKPTAVAAAAAVSPSNANGSTSAIDRSSHTLTTSTAASTPSKSSSVFREKLTIHHI